MKSQLKPVVKCRARRKALQRTEPVDVARRATEALSRFLARHMPTDRAVSCASLVHASVTRDRSIGATETIQHVLWDEPAAVRIAAIWTWRAVMFPTATNIHVAAVAQRQASEEGSSEAS
jgi:hypothetical protein